MPWKFTEGPLGIDGNEWPWAIRRGAALRRLEVVQTPAGLEVVELRRKREAPASVLWAA